MKIKLNELKTLLKEEATYLKALRKEINDGMRNRRYMGNKQRELIYKKRDYRHRHIAYSELCGRTRDEIEKPRPDNLPDESWITSIKESFSEAVCNNAA